MVNKVQLNPGLKIKNIGNIMNDVITDNIFSRN